MFEHVTMCLDISWYIFILRKVNNKSTKPFDHLSANPTEWSNTLKQFVGNSLITASIILLLITATSSDLQKYLYNILLNFILHFSSELHL